MPTTNTFIVSWDCEGLESCVDLTKMMIRSNKIDKENLFERIKNPDEVPANAATSEINGIVHRMQLRARYNPQRNYEIYLIDTANNISDKDLVQMFTDSPQASAELIRERGNKLYSDRRTTERKIS